jgi:hypothetical protein
MPVPNIFASATSAIPLSQLDQNFATAITLGNTAVYLGNTTTSLGNVTLTNVTISSGNVTVSAGSNTSPSITTVGDTNTGIFFPAADTIAFAEGGVETMRLDSAGNMGLGVTPSAWASRTVLEVGAAGNAFVSGGAGDVYVTEGCYYNAGWKYGNSLYATALYNQYRGTHSWSTAASGTAGNTISFTQAMTLDASGNLGVGETSPTFRISIKGDTSVKSGMNFKNTVQNQELQIGCSAGSTDSFFNTISSSPIYFGTNNTERVRIGASGGLAIQQGLSVGTPTVYLSSIFFASAVLSAGAGTYPLKWNSSTGIVTYDTSSRLVKENIEDSPYGLTEVLQLKSRKYHRTDDQRDEIGLVADEVQAVMPEFVPLVAKSIFTKDEADTELIAGGVNYDKLTSVLIKAIQEQQALITQLQADVAALKGASA